MTTTPVPVLAAVIRRDGRILLSRRPSNKRYGDLWEFPGGKILPSEDLEHAARRELSEELGVEVVSVGALVFEKRDPGSSFLIKFVDVEIKGVPKPLERQRLAWVLPAELLEYELAPVDRAFAAVLYREILAGPK